MLNKGMKKYLLLVLMVYVFGVVLRVVGQLMNGQNIDIKSTLLLGELDGQPFDFSKRWFARIAVLFSVPLFFIKVVK